MRKKQNIKSKKCGIIALFTITICLCVLFSGCKNEPNPPPPPQTVATLTANPTSGQVADNTAITLATTTTGAAIYYTQNGTEPTAASTLYSDTAKPVITTGKLTLKAIAVKSGMNNSEVMTATYTIATVSPPEPTPPTASITNNNQTVTLAPELEITLNGAATKGTNEIKSYEWTVKTTENGVTPVFTSGATAITKVTGIKKAGTYVFELKVKDTADLEGTATATVVVNGYTATKDVTVSFPAFVVSTTLSLTPTYTPTDGWGDFSASDITFTLSSVNPVKDLSDCNNGNIPASKYADSEYPTITQTFYYSGQVVGNRKFVTFLDPLRFVNLHEYKPTQIDGVWYDSDFVDITTIPPITLTLSKTITEILPPPVTKTVTVSFPAEVHGVRHQFCVAYRKKIMRYI
jgi:hypothetical protein